MGNWRRLLLTYHRASKSLGDNGRKLLDMLNVWRKSRGDIDFQDTEVGFNIVIRSNKGVITFLVFWGEIGQRTKEVMETRQHTYPPFVKIDRADKIRISQGLQKAYFQPTSGPNMNVRLEFGQLPSTPDRLCMIVNVIDEAVEAITKKVE